MPYNASLLIGIDEKEVIASRICATLEESNEWCALMRAACNLDSYSQELYEFHIEEK